MCYVDDSEFFNSFKWGRRGGGGVINITDISVIEMNWSEGRETPIFLSCNNQEIGVVPRSQ